MSQRIKVTALIDSVYGNGLKAGVIKGAAEAVIETQIEDEFEGWEGETIVKLMNGQIWQQTEYHYEYFYSYLANVVVYRSGSGYKMLVEGAHKAIGVTRLK